MKSEFSFLPRWAFVVGLFVQSAACLPSRDDWGADLEPPRVSEISLGPCRSGALQQGVHPGEPILLIFSEPVHPGRVTEEHIVLVPGEEGVECVGNSDCGSFAEGLDGVCLRGVCWQSRVGSGFLSDLKNPPLAESRASLRHRVRLVLNPAGTGVTVLPDRPLRPRTPYTLAISSAVADLADNPLTGPDGLAAPFVYHFVTADPYEGCGEIRLVRPSSGIVGVPLNLPRLFVSASLPLPGPAANGVRLVRVETGETVAQGVRPEPGGCGSSAAAGSGCYSMEISGELAPFSRFELAAAVVGEQGGDCAFVPFDTPQQFVTGGSADTEAPSLDLVAARVDARCLSFRVLSSEPVSLLVSVWRAAQVGVGLPLVTEPVAEPSAEHQVGLDLSALAAGTAIALVVEGRDLVDLPAVSEPVTLEVGPELPFVAITEVLANPAGPEPDQEFVEIYNLSDRTVVLEGWSVSDSEQDTGDPLSTGELAAGQFGLLVGKGYDPFQGQDPSPDPSVPLFRSDTSLASSGLSNSGEPLFLWDGQGRLVSAYREAANVSGSGHNGCSVELIAPSVCGSGGGFSSNLDGRSTPGGPNSHWLQ